MSKEGANCPQCNSNSHFECVGLPGGAQISDSWRCGDCQRRVPKGRDPATPVRTSQENYTLSAAGTAAAAEEEEMVLDTTANNITAEFSEMELHIGLRSALRDDFAQEFRTLREDFLGGMNSLSDGFHTLTAEVKQLRTEVADFRAALAGVTERVDGVEKRIEDLERRIERPPALVVHLQTKVSLLEQELNERDQEALLADLEIGHLPEEKGESVVHAVTVLASKLGVALEPRDVVFAERVGVAQGAGAGGGAPRARRIVVRMARRDLREQLIQGARARRTLTAADAGLTATEARGRIFLNERLTRTNRQLFHRVREECRRLQWRFSWTKRGRIYAREADGKPAFPIRTAADIERVFGKPSC